MSLNTNSLLPWQQGSVEGNFNIRPSGCLTLKKPPVFFTQIKLYHFKFFTGHNMNFEILEMKQGTY